LLELLAACRAACEQTGGAFDVTVGALLEAYGFYAEGEAAPDPAALAAARLRVGCDVLEFEPERARLRVPGARLDLGAVAKGWAVDRMVAVLKTHGIEHALVWAGGSAMRAFGHEPGQEGWTVQIPGAQDARSVVLHDEALATSGQLSTPFFVDGRLASHVLDPRVGRPVDHGTLVSVVVASDATRADIYSTALLVLGPEETEAWWPRQGPASGLSGALQIGVDPDVRERRVESSWGRPFTSP
jgi:thiamine biosynthesis lipoprotein